MLKSQTKVVVWLSIEVGKGEDNLFSLAMLVREMTFMKETKLQGDLYGHIASLSKTIKHGHFTLLPLVIH